MHFIEKIWYPKNIFYRSLAYLLLPLSAIYYSIICLRHKFSVKPKKLSAPVIVIGNLTVGGTGKTPLVIYYVEKLKAEGKTPGVISRGYKGQAKTWPQLVTAQSDPILVGDEPVLIALKTAVPVCVGPNRYLNAQKLIREFSCDVIISDDGLAHYALPRDEEVLVVDGLRHFGNGFLLPAGPLREPKSRLKSVNKVLTNGVDFKLIPGKIYPVKHPERNIAPAEFVHENVHAVCAIGNPQRFFNSLTELGLKFTPHIFPDHHIFKAEELSFEGLVIMTEKDAVKAAALSDDRHYALSVIVDFS